MAVNYLASLKTTRMQAVIDRIDIGAAGSLELCTTAYGTVLASIPLQKPSFTISGDTITLAGVPRTDSSANASGDAAVARIKASNGDVVVSGLTVGIGTGDIQVNSIAITQNQAVTITAGSIQHSA